MKANCINTSGELLTGISVSFIELIDARPYTYFSDLHPSVRLSDFVKDIKVASNIWMKDSGKFPLFYGWQDAYAAFTYSIREKDTIIEYIKNQKEHHKKETFFDEYKRLLTENGIKFDEKYLL